MGPSANARPGDQGSSVAAADEENGGKREKERAQKGGLGRAGLGGVRDAG